MFSISMYSQGLGLTKKEVHELRQGQRYIDDTTSMGYRYNEYQCTGNYLCTATTYVFNKIDETILVMDLFELRYLSETMKYLNNKAIYTSNFIWVDEPCERRLYSELLARLLVKKGTLFFCSSC